MARFALKDALLIITSFLFILSLCSARFIREEDESGIKLPFRQLLSKESESNCTPAAILEFPSDSFTREQRRNGWVLIHFVLSFYSIILLSTVCDEYFVPAIQTLVLHLKIPEDIAGASFMAITSASPELFVNFVGTFITQGDIGVGTVVGSNVFNVLAVPACCLVSKLTFQLDWYSMTRDCFVYGISVVLLITTLWDDKVQWYEALLFIIVYMAYILVMYCNENMQRVIKRKPKFSGPQHDNADVPLTTVTNANDQLKDIRLKDNHLDTEKQKDEKSYVPVEKKGLHLQMWWIFTLPIKKLFQWTVPDCRKHPKVYALTLLMCMFWIGVGSYLLTWFITVIGDTLSIPDSVVGLSFVAVGSSIPEVVSCIIIAKQGQAAMGISSALGANTFEILLCLGLPWLLKTVIYPKTPGNHWIIINSSGLAYNAGSLFSTLIFLYISLLCTRFRLSWKIGIICLIAYAVFLIVGTLIELNFFFPVNLPTCEIE